MWQPLLVLDEVNAGSRDDAADQRSQDWNKSVTPIRGTLAGDWQDGMSHARTEVTSGVHGVTGWATKAQTEHPDQAAPQIRSKSRRQAVRRNCRRAECEADADQRGRRDDFGQEVLGKIADRRPGAEDTQLGAWIVRNCPVGQIDQPGQDGADEGVGVFDASSSLMQATFRQRVYPQDKDWGWTAPGPRASGCPTR